MKSGNIIISIVSAVFMGVVVIWFMATVNETKDRERQQYIDSLFRQSRESITFDSIRSVIEKRLGDSIGMIRSELITERAIRRRETQLIKRETQRIRNLIDSIGPIERPDL